MIYHIDRTTSTNDDARDAKYREGDIIWADFQTAGRGQRGHKWESRAGENLLFTAVLEPHFLPVQEQFVLSQTVALALTDLFAEYGIAASVKWTNDIYAGDRKLVGILIEHIYSGTSLSRTIAGIGINVNQTQFDPSLPNPVSVAQLCGRSVDAERMLRRFADILAAGYGALRTGGEAAKERVRERYHGLLWRRDEWHWYALPDGTRFRGMIRGVRPTGELIVEHDDGSTAGFMFRQIEFVLHE